jgi:hypothetical protein
MVLRFHLTFALVVVLCSLACVPKAATIESKEGSDPHTVVIYIDGDIADSDGATLGNILSSLSNSSKIVSAFRLNSPGGMVLEGGILAEMIRRTGAPTVVANNNICASACFLLFAAGSTKFASRGAKIGVHSAWAASGEETAEAAAGSLVMARIARSSVCRTILSAACHDPSRPDCLAVGARTYLHENDDDGPSARWKP